MKKVSRPILLADDLSNEGARACAAALAKRLGSPLHLMYVEGLLQYPVTGIQFKSYMTRYLVDQKNKLDQLAKSLSPPAKAYFVKGEPIAELAKVGSKISKYEMLALGTHGRTGLSRMLLGSVAEEVIRQSRLPVMTVGPQAREAGAAGLTASPLKILVPTSLTQNSARAEAYAIQLAKKLGAEVILIYSMREALAPVLQTAFAVKSAPPEVRELEAEMKARFSKQLATLQKKFQKAGVSCTSHLDSETLRASEAITRVQEVDGAALIVMGTRGRSWIKGALLGRTARDVILGAPVPVITVASK